MTSVLHVSQAVEYGVGRYLSDLVTDQARRGWRLAVATTASEQLEALCAREGVAHHRWDAQRSPGPSVAGEMRTLNSILHNVEPDVVHLHSSKAGLVGRLALRSRRPTIFSPHGWSFLHEGQLMQRASLVWERAAGRWADLIVCGSDAERRRGEQAGIRGELRVVPNAVDLSRYSLARPGERETARTRQLGAAAANAPLVVCVGRLVRQKGIDILLDAWPGVRARVDRAELVVVGDGELRDKLAARAPDDVHFVGPSERVRDWFVAADVVVQPSRFETLSLSVLEALACGRTVVATDVEGMREALGADEATRAGAIVPCEDPIALGAEIVRRLQDPALREAEEARARGRGEQFGLEAWGDRVAAITTEAITRRTGRATMTAPGTSSRPPGAHLRVLMVSSLWPPHVIGGAELYASTLAERLRTAGHEVGVVTLGVAGPDVVADVRARPYRLDEYSTQSAARRAVFHALDIYRPSTVRSLTEAFTTFRPDIVHTHSVQGLSSAALETPARRNVAHVHTLHDYWLLCQRTTMVARDGTLCERLCGSCSLVSRVRNSIIARHPPHVALAISAAVAREHERIAWLRARMRALPHPVEWLPRPPERADRPIMFGYLGQLSRVKGVSGLLDAFDRASLGDARLLIAGDGPERDELSSRASANVEFVGWLDAPSKAAFLDTIDCLVVPSEWKEPAGLVVNEARGHYVPVIAARIGGIPELVPEASRPLLFRAGDRAELALRLEQFAQSPLAYREKQRGASLDWPDHLAAVTEAYEDARRDRREVTGAHMTAAVTPPVVRAAVLADALDGGGGMGRYTRELLCALDRRPDIEPVVVAPPAALAVLGSIGLGRVETIEVPGRGQISRGLWEQYVLPRHLRGVDVVHGTKHLLPRTELPTLLTVHDVIAIRSPQEFDLAKRLLLPRQYRNALSRATMLLAVSETTKRRISELDRALGEKTVVVPNAVTSDLMRAEPKPLPGLDGRRFALVVGDLSPRKNVSTLLDVWARPDGPPADLMLVVVGPEGWRRAEVKKRLENMERDGIVLWARQVGDAELRYCYDHAQVVLAPSIEEGFGLPVAEALALGAKVVASRDPALVEVARGRAVHVDARDVDGWVAAITAATADRTDAVDQAAPAPPSQVPTWDENAGATVDLYRRAIRARAGRRRMIVMAVPDFHPTPAGTARQTAKQAKAVMRDGYDVVVLTRRYDPAWPRTESLDGVSVVRFGPTRRSGAAEKLALGSLAGWLLRHRRRVTALQLLGYADFALSAALAGLARRAVNVWVTDGDADETLGPRPGAARAVQRRLRRAALAPGVQVALTPTIERELAAVGLRERVEIIPTPVDLSAFHPPDAEERQRARANCGLADGEFVVLYAGLLRERKRVERLIDAVGVLRATDADLRLLVVGGSLGGEEHIAEALHRQVADAGLGDVVEFVGPVDDVRRYLWAADLFVLPSDREGLPNSLQEAMACGVPCVAPRSAAGHEVMGTDAGVVPPGNSVQEIADGIALLRNDPERAARIRSAALERVPSFSLERVARSYEDLFERLAGTARPQRP